jgi:hypothetical protein
MLICFWIRRVRILAGYWRATANFWIWDWDFKKYTSLFLILMLTNIQRRRQEILINKYIWITLPYSCHWYPWLDILWCERIWHGLAYYERDVVNCHLFPGLLLIYASDTLLTKFLKGPWTDLSKGCGLEKIWFGNDIIIPFSLQD